MPSQIDPTKPIDGVPASKADLRANLQAAKGEIEALQSGKADLGHQHGLLDISDAGALASKNTVAAVDINDDAVTNAKLANMAAATFKGRAAGAGTGDPTDLTAAQAKTALAISTSDVSGLGTLATLDQVGTGQISDGAVTNAKLADMAAATFKGRAAGAGTGDPTDLTAAQTKTVLAISTSDVSGLGTLATLNQVGTGQISDDAVTNVKLANMAAATFKGRAAGGGTGDPTDLTAAQAKTALAISTADVSGLGALATLNQVGTGQISDDAVTYAKMQNVSAASRLLGRGQAGGAGDPEEIVLGSGLSMTGTTLTSEFELSGQRHDRAGAGSHRQYQACQDRCWCHRDIYDAHDHDGGSGRRLGGRGNVRRAQPHPYSSQHNQCGGPGGAQPGRLRADLR